MPITLLDRPLLGGGNCLTHLSIPKLTHTVSGACWAEVYRLNERIITAATEYLLCDKHDVRGLDVSSHYILGSLIGRDSLISCFSGKETGLGD